MYVLDSKIGLDKKWYYILVLSFEYRVFPGFSRHTLQIYTAGIGTHVKSVKVTSICHRYYHVKV